MRTLHASALTLSLLAATEASAQVYLSDYLGSSGCSVTAPNPPYATAVATTGRGIGIDTPGSWLCEPIRIAGRRTYRKGLGMYPPLSGVTVVEFDLDAIRQSTSQPIDVFEGTVGMHTGSVNGTRFEVFLDGSLRESVDIDGVRAHRTLRIPVVQASTLRLETSRLGNWNSNAAVWADAKLVTSESSILSWGQNTNGQGDVPATPTLSLAGCLGNFSLGLLSDGSVLAWGENGDGQLDPPAAPAGTRYVQLAGGAYRSLGLLSDGSLLSWGRTSFVPSQPAGITYVEVSGGGGHALAVLSNGSVEAWGSNGFGQHNIPAANNYVAVACGANHSLALTSDGGVVAAGLNNYGQCTVPGDLTVGLGLDRGRDIAAGNSWSMALTVFGSVSAWGNNIDGQTNAPPPPTGERYIEIAAGGHHGLARTNNGTVVAWGRNNAGQTNVPALPAGVVYEEIAAGFEHSVARRSDGVIVAWGANGSGQSTAPPIGDVRPTFTKVAGGENHALALRSDGRIAAWGDNTHGELDVPPLPNGAVYADMDAGLWHSLALRDDGQIVAWGDNSGGQLNVPALPSGVAYVDVAAGRFHSLAVRSDGVAVGWGANSAGEATVPTLAAGLTWADLDADAGAFSSLGLVSDGSVRAWGFDNFGQVSQAPTGAGFVEIVTGVGTCLARRNDGTVVHWGDGSNGVGTLPTLPPGRAYEQLALGWYHGVGLLDSGEAVTWGSNYAGQLDVGPAPAQSQYVEIAAGTANSYARIERRATLETWGVGCSFEGAPSSIYEEFPQIVNSDIPGSTITWQRVNNGYNVANGLPGTFVAPPAGATVVAGGALDGQQQFTLSSPMPAAGGAVSVLNVTTKGLIELGGASSSGVDFTPTVAELLASPNTLFACWHDYDQNAFGTITFHEAGGIAYATWDNVASYGAFGTGASTFQFQFDLASGDVRLVHVAITGSIAESLIVGYSQAGPSSQAIAVDLTQAVLLAPVFDNTPGLELSASGLPELGNTSFVLKTANVPPLLPIAFFEFAATRLDPGIELSFLGMPGCYKLTDDTLVIASRTVDPGTTTASYSLPIPSNAGLIGAGFACQSLAFSQATQFNLITSNGLEFTINY